VYKSSGNSGSGPKRGPGEGLVSIRDVAAAARVSIATVSRVLHASPTVAAATAARVRKAIEELGYVPNPMAQALGAGRSHVIGLALPRFHGEFMSFLLAGADEEATTLGYHLMMTTIVEGVDGRRRSRIVGSGLVDAMLVVITDLEDPLARDVVEAGVPSVVLDADMTEHGLDSVVLDNEKGTREAIDHLLRWTEPTSIYFVGGPKSNFDTLRRAAAFTELITAAGAVVRPDQISMGDYSLEWGKEWALRAFARGALSGAVLAANDKIACGIIHAAKEVGVRVPDQLRVVGFNDSLVARIVHPNLSTVALPMAEMGATAVRLLVRRIENPGGEPLCRRLPTKLVVRESSTAINF